MKINLETIVVALLGSGVITAFISWAFSRRKTSAETDGIVADTYSQMLNDVKSEMRRYQAMLTAANRRIYALEVRDAWRERRIQQLEMALTEAHIPIPDASPHPGSIDTDQLMIWGLTPEEGETIQGDEGTTEDPSEGHAQVAGQPH